MDPKLVKEIEDAKAKHEEGIKLTDREWMLLAYTHHAGGCASCAALGKHPASKAHLN